MKNRLFFLISIAMMGVLHLSAQESTDKWYMVADNKTYVLLTDVEYLLSVNEEPEFTIVKKDGGLIESVKEITFSNTAPTGIASANTEDKVSTVLNSVESSLTISGLNTSTVAKIFSTNGILLISKELSPNKSSIDISSLQSGTYLLTVNKTTIKFIKK